MWCPAGFSWLLVAQAIVSKSNINILIFAPLVLHEQNERPAVEEMMDSRKPFSKQWLQLSKEDNDV